MSKSHSPKQTVFNDGDTVQVILHGRYEGMLGTVIRRSPWQDPQTNLIRYEVQLSNGHYMSGDRTAFKPVRAESGGNIPQGTDDRPHADSPS